MSALPHSRSVQTYSMVWAAAGAVALMVAAWVAITGTTPTFAASFWLLAGVTAIAELIELDFQWSDADRGGFSLVEVGIAASLLLLPAPEALLAVTLGMLVSQILRRRSPTKVAYNVGHRTAAVGAAAGIVAALPATGPTIEGTAVVSVLVGMAAYTVIDFLGLIGLLQRLVGQNARETVRNHGWLTVAVIAGSTAVGLILAGV